MPFLDPDDFAPTGLDVRQLLVSRPSSTFFMTAKGDELDTVFIHDGDILVVDRSIEPVKGDIAVVAEDGQLAVRVINDLEQLDVWGTVAWSITQHCKR